MIRLTKSGNGEPVYVSPDLIVSAEIVDDVTMLNVRSDRIFVLESPEEVARKVLEWKLKMAKYQASLYRGNMGAAEICASGLHMLVGLGDADIDKIVGEFLKEEPNHDAG